MNFADQLVIWTTRDGREIPLEEMEERHIVNAINVLAAWRRDARRRGEKTTVRELQTTLGVFKREQKRRAKRVTPPRLMLPAPEM